MHSICFSFRCNSYGPWTPTKCYYAVHSICFSFRCNSYGPWTPTKCDSILIFTSFYKKVCRGIVFFNTKMSYLSVFKRTKSKILRTASMGRITNWTKPPCDPVQIIRTKDWYFLSLIIVNTATSYNFTNLHVIYFWNGHREWYSSHWHLQLHITRFAERYTCKWRCADLHSDAKSCSHEYTRACNTFNREDTGQM